MGKLKQQFSTDGFAIWTTGNQEEHKLDIHISEWLNPPIHNYIDIGIRIYNSNNITDCFIFVPYSLNNNELIDLAPNLAEEKVARGIFNANCSIHSSSDSQIIKMVYKGRKENIIILSNIPSVKQLGGGSLIHIPLNSIKPELIYNDSYIRFRIPHKTLNKLFIQKNHDFKFQFESPILTDRYNYVIKVNEVRSLPFEVRNIFPKSGVQVLKIISIFYADEKYTIDDSLCYKIRNLEHDLFDSYMPNDFSCTNIIVYQWIIENKLHYNFNIKIEHSRIIWISLLVYALLIIFFNFVSNILWELLF